MPSILMVSRSPFLYFNPAASKRLDDGQIWACTLYGRLLFTYESGELILYGHFKEYKLDHIAVMHKQLSLKYF